MRRWRIPGDNIVSSHPSCVGPPIIFFPLLQVFEDILATHSVTRGLEHNIMLCSCTIYNNLVSVYCLSVLKRRLDHVMGMFLYL